MKEKRKTQVKVAKNLEYQLWLHFLVAEKSKQKLKIHICVFFGTYEGLTTITATDSANGMPLPLVILLLLLLCYAVLLKYLF